MEGRGFNSLFSHQENLNQDKRVVVAVGEESSVAQQVKQVLIKKYLLSDSKCGIYQTEVV